MEEVLGEKDCHCY